VAIYIFYCVDNFGELFLELLLEPYFSVVLFIGPNVKEIPSISAGAGEFRQTFVDITVRPNQFTTPTHSDGILDNPSSKILCGILVTRVPSQSGLKSATSSLSPTSLRPLHLVSLPGSGESRFRLSVVPECTTVVLGQPSVTEEVVGNQVFVPVCAGLPALVLVCPCSAG
jgi:hypothetical protein